VKAPPQAQESAPPRQHAGGGEVSVRFHGPLARNAESPGGGDPPARERDSERGASGRNAWPVAEASPLPGAVPRQAADRIRQPDCWAHRRRSPTMCPARCLVPTGRWSPSAPRTTRCHCCRATRVADRRDGRFATGAFHVEQAATRVFRLADVPRGTVEVSRRSLVPRGTPLLGAPSTPSCSTWSTRKALALTGGVSHAAGEGE
jgi:hypothetical protein